MNNKVPDGNLANSTDTTCKEHTSNFHDSELDDHDILANMDPDDVHMKKREERMLAQDERFGGATSIFSKQNLWRLAEWSDDSAKTGQPENETRDCWNDQRFEDLQRRLVFYNRRQADILAFQLSYIQVRGRAVWPRRLCTIIATDSDSGKGKKYLLFPDRGAALRHLSHFAGSPQSTFYDMVRPEQPVQFYADIDLDQEKLALALSLGIWSTPLELANEFASKLDEFLAHVGVPSVREGLCVSDSSARGPDDKWIKMSLHVACEHLVFTNVYKDLFRFTGNLYAFIEYKADCRSSGCTEGCSVTCPHLRWKYFTKAFGVFDIKVYGTNNQMRTLYSTKQGKDRFFRPLAGFNARTDALAIGPTSVAIEAFLANLPIGESHPRGKFFNVDVLTPYSKDWRCAQATDTVQFKDVDGLKIDCVPGARVFKKKEYATQYCNKLIAGGHAESQIVSQEVAPAKKDKKSFRYAGGHSESQIVSHKVAPAKKDDEKSFRYIAITSYAIYEAMRDAVPKKAWHFNSVFSPSRGCYLFYDLDDCNPPTFELFIRARNAYLRSIDKPPLDENLLRIKDNYHVVDRSWWFEDTTRCRSHVQQMSEFFKANEAFRELVVPRLAQNESNSEVTGKMKTVLDLQPYTGSLRDLGSSKFSVGRPLRVLQSHLPSVSAIFFEFFPNAQVTAPVTDRTHIDRSQQVVACERPLVWSNAIESAPADESTLPDRMKRTRGAWGNAALRPDIEKLMQLIAPTVWQEHGESFKLALTLVDLGVPKETIDEIRKVHKPMSSKQKGTEAQSYYFKNALSFSGDWQPSKRLAKYLQDSATPERSFEALKSSIGPLWLFVQKSSIKDAATFSALKKPKDMSDSEKAAHVASILGLPREFPAAKSYEVIDRPADFNNGYVSHLDLRTKPGSAEAVYVSAGLGGGKTEALMNDMTIQFFDQVINSFLVRGAQLCVMLSPRRVFSTSIADRGRQVMKAKGLNEHIDVVNYMDEKEYEIVSKGKTFLIISPESLHRLNLDLGYRTVLYIDEVEAILNSFTSSKTHICPRTGRSKKCDNMSVFERIVRSPNTSLIGFDAFLGSRTIDWSVAIGRDRISVYNYQMRRTRALTGLPDKWYTVPPADPPKKPQDKDEEAFRTAADCEDPHQLYDPVEPLMNLIVEKCKKGWSFFAMFGKVLDRSFAGTRPSVKLLKAEAHQIITHVVNKVKRRVPMKDEEVGVMWSLQNDFKALEDPNVAWKPLRGLCMSSTGNVGINHTEPGQFTARFGLITRSSANVREIMQGFARTRYPQTEKIFVLTLPTRGGKYDTVHRLMAEMSFDIRQQLVCGVRATAKAILQAYSEEDVRQAKRVLYPCCNCGDHNVHAAPAWLRSIYISSTLERGINMHFQFEVQAWFRQSAGIILASPEEVAAEISDAPLEGEEAAGVEDSKEKARDRMVESTKECLTVIKRIVEIDFHAIGLLVKLYQKTASESTATADPMRSTMERCLKKYQSVSRHTTLYKSRDGGSVFKSNMEDPGSVQLQGGFDLALDVFRPFVIDGSRPWEALANADVESAMRIERVPFQEMLRCDTIPAESRDIKVLQAQEVINIVDVLKLQSSWDVETKIPFDDERIDNMLAYLSEEVPLHQVETQFWSHLVMKKSWQRKRMTRFQRISTTFGRRTHAWPDPKAPSTLLSVQQMQKLLNFVFSSWIGAKFDRGYEGRKRKRVDGVLVNISPYAIRFTKPEETAEPDTSRSLGSFFSVYTYSTTEQFRDFQAYNDALPCKVWELRQCLESSYPHVKVDVLQNESTTEEDDTRSEDSMEVEPDAAAGCIAAHLAGSVLAAALLQAAVVAAHAVPG